MSKFNIGPLVMTRTISDKIDNNPQFRKDVDKALTRYCQADWSDMKYEEDKKMNDNAVKNGDARIFATYNTCEGTIYIITEWDRSATTILFPDEY